MEIKRPMATCFSSAAMGFDSLVVKTCLVKNEHFPYPLEAFGLCGS
jgi:hypothetical protein